ncbi:hypothetical protein KOW79_001550 [Hemibagrus wyckioides]|uniref:PHD-type domain-containing protein n=1 Tax=Hemibagrus wyckioides TaxID=337641 RepID=A0A9D3SX99_9TELE|nr:hypothetical protein KOW79_001550 [Hemibagrus wyckioides]
MQSFRERGGFQGNQRCYQQEAHELSRLENYRHHSQTGQGYEVHSLSAAGMPTAGTSSKDCYGQQPYPSYGSSSAQSKKPYRGGKAPSQHLQAGYSSHINSGYSSQYMSEGHLQQKWDESGQISQYEQDIVGHLEPGASGSSQYLEQNMLAISQSQCQLPSQPSAPVYTSPHQQGHPPNPTASPIMYPQSHIHFPQHSQPPSSTSSSYMEKCNPIPHGYKSGYGMPPNAQYSRQMGNHTSLKQSGYRPQNNYGYQQPSSRAGFEQQASLQGMSGTPESLQKFPHYNQPQQNYCITDISVRSPEQYYQNCSPSSSHSPARSVGRSPSYSSTPSPLMPNPDTFQYGQPINPPSSSVNLQDPNMLMPPHTHPSPSVNHQSQSYSSSMKDRFSEKLFSNPSLWSLNALTSQVENISNNVQQLLLSEALMANKKGNKRNQPKKGDEYRGQLKAMEDSSCPDSQHAPLPSDSYSTPRSMPSDLLEVGYSSSTEDQMERNYYYFGQGKGPTHASAQSQLSLDTVSTCSMNSTDDMSVRSGDSDRSIQSAASEDNLSCDPRVQRVPFGEEQHSSLRSVRNERSPISVTAPSPMKQESNSPIGIKQSESTQKENFEESAWTERINDEKEIGKIKLPTEHKCKGEVFEATDKRQEWLEDEKCPSFFHKLNKEVSNESYSYETEDNIYQKLKNKYETEEGDFVGKCCDTSSKGNEDSEMKSEMFKSESQNNGDDPITVSPAISKDVPEPSLYLPRKEESSETPHLTSECESSEERLLTPERETDIFDEQQSALSYSVNEVREKGSLTSSEDVINNKAKLEETPTEACNNQGDTASGPLCVVNTEIAETPAQDIAHRSSERTSVTCDIAPQSHPVRSGFSALNEKTTPQNQVRDHIDHSDAKVLEPDSPQLPGKSIISSAPSWADTPPSPQKGDEDVEPGISCPSATKPEPMAPSAHPRLLGRKHARGRRRLIHSNPGMRTVERDGASPSPQKPSMLSSNSAIFSDQMEAVQLDISSQTPKLLTEGIPSPKDQKSMVLRSRKQTREKLTDDKEKEREISTEAPAIKPPEAHIQKVAAAQPCENLTSTLKSPNHEDICTDSLSQLNEQIVSVSIKRKSSLQAPDTVKKKKGLKVSQTKTSNLEPQPQELVVEAQGSKGRRKRGLKLEPSTCRTLTKDNLPLEDISDTPCVPPQCPTKTKYLPPRKGRGLKYEAMVQKITSPASKKQPLNIQPDVVIEELAPKPSPELQVPEKRKAVNTTMITTEEGESTVSIDETPDTACIQTPRKKRRKWATVESTDTPDIALETGSLIINTPRLAKQRAIKNNHEMHLKQRKKRRKGTELAKSVPNVETHEQTDVFISPPVSPPSPPPTSSLFSNTEEKTQGEQLAIEIGSTVIKSKRGRRPSLKKKQEDLGQHIGNEEGQKVKKKPGPKKKIQQNNNSTIKVTVKGLKPKIKCKKECIPTVKGILTDFLDTNDSKHSFKPYVHIDRSKRLASLCTIINKPEEEHLLVQIRKKNLEKNKTIPNSSVMLQGPLVNRSLTDRCLICCLCGKPANYRELGDLCGPYYPENTIPRKTLSLTYHEDFRQNREGEQDKVAMCTSEQITDVKREGEKDLLQEGTSEGECRQVMRERRAQLRSRLGLRARFKRLQLLQGRAGGGVPPAGEEGSYSVLQRLQLEAEVNEHWAHESCTVWTNGVILIAGKLYGLKEAAWESTLTKCSKCQTEGASISCSWKNCIHKYHYVCAKETGCIFDEDTFLIKCPKHQAM